METGDIPCRAGGSKVKVSVVFRVAVSGTSTEEKVAFETEAPGDPAWAEAVMARLCLCNVS